MVGDRGLPSYTTDGEPVDLVEPTLEVEVLSRVKVEDECARLRVRSTRPIVRVRPSIAQTPEGPVVEASLNNREWCFL